MKFKIYFNKLFTIFLLLISYNLFSQNINKEELELKLNELTKLSLQERKEKIELLDLETANSLLSYIRYKYIKDNVEMEIIFSLYDQLANIKAIDFAQKRLNRLLIVIIITLLLFSFYLTYILVSQNKIIKELNEYKNIDLKKTTTKKAIYTGE